jgi:O-antigen/teichoic acid export membrane protein
MTLRKNITANYLSQIYITVIGIVMVPLYLKYVGAEAYGLVGFFSMLQAWFNLLDLGLTPTMARETARFRGGALDALTFRRFVRALEGLFFVLALFGGGILLLLSGLLATNWLNVQQLPTSEVLFSIKMMSIAVSFRWMSGLYRGQISGSERLVWLSGYNSIIATMRFGGVLLVLIFIGTTPSVFFSYQLCVALIELAGLMVMSYRLLPSIPEGERSAWSWAPLKPVLRFSLTIAFTTSVWVLVTQTDKLVLSKILSLAEYGYFSLAVLVANGVMMISGPISSAIMPRMAKMEAEGDHAGLIRIYRQSTQLVAVIAGSACVTVAFCAEPLLLAWTGDKVLARHAVSILVLYAIGNGVLAISAFPYYLQYAKGNLRLHLIGNAGFIVLLIPSIIWSASHYGGVGAGYAWLVMNIIYFIAWVPFVHNKFEPGLNTPWYVRDVLAIVVVASLVGYGMYSVMPQITGRLWMAVSVTSFGAIVLLASACASSVVWEKVYAIINHRQIK